MKKQEVEVMEDEDAMMKDDKCTGVFFSYRSEQSCRPKAPSGSDSAPRAGWRNRLYTGSPVCYSTPDSYSVAYIEVGCTAEPLLGDTVLQLEGSCLSERYPTMNPCHRGAGSLGRGSGTRTRRLCGAFARSGVSRFPSDCSSPLGGFLHREERHWAAGAQVSGSCTTVRQDSYSNIQHRDWRIWNYGLSAWKSEIESELVNQKTPERQSSN